MVFGVFAASLSADSEWEISENRLVRYLGKEKTVTIPSEINGFTVSTVGKVAFGGSNVESVYIPDSVLKIESGVFQSCDYLQKVRLSKNLTDIGEYAFYDTSSLTELYIPKSVENIGEMAFGYKLDLSDECLGPVLHPSFRAYVYSDTEAERYCKTNRIVYTVIDKDFDINNDGEVDITDAMILFYGVAQKAPLDAGIGDLNKDNATDISDAMRLFYYVAKKY